MKERDAALGVSVLPDKYIEEIHNLAGSCNGIDAVALVAPVRMDNGTAHAAGSYQVGDVMLAFAAVIRGQLLLSLDVTVVGCLYFSLRTLAGSTICCGKRNLPLSS